MYLKTLFCFAQNAREFLGASKLLSKPHLLYGDVWELSIAQQRSSLKLSFSEFGPESFGEPLNSHLRIRSFRGHPFANGDLHRRIFAPVALESSRNPISSTEMSGN